MLTVHRQAGIYDSLHELHFRHSPRTMKRVGTLHLANRSLLAVLLSAIALGFAARFALAWFSIGTNDAVTWRKFATGIGQRGLVDAYGRFPSLNHPPLPALWSAAALRISRVSGASFEFIFKFPAILADLATCVLLCFLIGPRGLPRAAPTRNPRLGGSLALPRSLVMPAIFALHPVAILISAYHCNTDSIVAFGCLLATYFAAQRRFALSGVALAAAINVKLIPLLLVLPLLSLCRDRREATRLLLGLCAGAIPFFLMLLSSEHFSRNVFSYIPPADRWGIALILYGLHLPDSTRQLALDVMRFYVESARYIILAAVALTSVFSVTRRRWDAYGLAALTLAMFLVLTPGFGVQYLVIIAPLLLARSVMWGAIYGLVAGTFLVMVYAMTWTGSVPMYSFFDDLFPIPAASVGAIAWGILLVYCIRDVLRQKEQPAD